ncbi:MAG: HDIG domain-containing protein [Candidatus Nealsonbacteria bacterium]|nr:HDIG domain-containing protein [Candidatus Nealsonbacteria bacterium]
MKKVDYFEIIQKYINPSSETYRFYIIHAILVTAKALTIGRKIGLSSEQLNFIEEAAMLHDIGIINTREKEIGCMGDKPYILHVVEGEKILRSEGLQDHARVAKNHIGVGITKSEIIEKELPLPPEDIVAEKTEDRVVSYSDLFYSKNPDLIWQERSLEKTEAKLRRLGDRQLKIFRKWHLEFGR